MLRGSFINDVTQIWTLSNPLPLCHTKMYILLTSLNLGVTKVLSPSTCMTSFMNAPLPVHRWRDDFCSVECLRRKCDCIGYIVPLSGSWQHPHPHHPSRLGQVGPELAAQVGSGESPSAGKRPPVIQAWSQFNKSLQTCKNNTCPGLSFTNLFYLIFLYQPITR